MSALSTTEAVLRIVGMVVDDVLEWAKGGDSTYDYSAFAERLNGKFKAEILLEREKARLLRKKPR